MRSRVCLSAGALALAACSACSDGSDGSDDAGSGGSLSGSGAGAGGNPRPPSGEPPPSLEELAESPAELAPWTILVYGHADHNLSYNLLQDMGEMAAAELDGAVQLVVLADWDSSQLIPEMRAATYFPEGLQLYRVAGGGAVPEHLAEAAEVNLDDPAALAEIVRAVFSGLPAERRGLVLWDHGGAWEGGFGGDTDNGTFSGWTGPMGAELVAAAVQAGLTAAGINEPQPLDFVAFDTCLMSGAEVAYPFRGLTNTYLAAAEIDYGAGWDYQATLTNFARNPTAPNAELAIAEVNHWDAHHAQASINDALLRSHAALDLSRLEAFAEASATLTAAMVESVSFDALELGRSAFFALSPYSSQFQAGSNQPGLRDIGQLLGALGTVQSDPAVAAAARAAREALGDVVLASSQGLLRQGEQVGMHVEQTLGPEDLVWIMFMGKYIFPGADASLCPSAMLKPIEKAGWELHSAENVSIHYSWTIQRWHEHWLRNEALVKARYGERWFRIWHLFLAWSASIAQQGNAACFQLVLNKNLDRFDRTRWVRRGARVFGLS